MTARPPYERTPEEEALDITMDLDEPRKPREAEPGELFEEEGEEYVE